MVYLYRKVIGNKEFYYLRASKRKGDKVISKDIQYLGNDINTVKDKLKDLPSKYANEIKKTYKTINRFIEINIYLDKIKTSKLKKDEFLSKENFEKIEACKLHWNTQFNKLDRLTKGEIIKNFIIEFAFNTTSIEGNTITLKEAQNLLLENLTPKNKTLREIYDLQNTEKVFLELFGDKNKELTNDLVCHIHDSLLENIDTRKGYRTNEVRVLKAGFKSSPAPYVKSDMDILLKWFKENENKLHPFVLATIFHHKFEKIHPFMDGNGRTGRVLMNYILLKKDYPPLMIRKKNRLTYLEQLRKADKCELTKINLECYNNIIEFDASEYENYWNIFL